MRTLLVASALLLTATPALAWQYESEKIENGHTYLSAWQGADTTDYSLQVECEETFADDPDVILFTPEKFDSAASYPSTVPMAVVIDGEKFDLDGGYENVDGNIAVVAYQSDDDDVKPVVDTIRTAKKEIRVTIPFGAEQVFGVGDAGKSIDAFEKACDALAGAK